MASTPQLLQMLNDYRVASGQKPLATWKESRAKLEAKILSITQAIPPVNDEDPPIEDAMTPVEFDNTPPPAPATVPIITIEEPAKKPAKAKKEKTKDLFLVSVADVARALGIHPKVARAKLRRYGGKTGYEWLQKTGDSWFVAKGENEVKLREFLQPAKK